jgi:hypothetical protein
VLAYDIFIELMDDLARGHLVEPGFIADFA